MKFKYIATALLLSASLSLHAGQLTWYSGGYVEYEIQKKYSPVVGKALEMFSSDMKAVTGKAAKMKSNAVIQIYQLNMTSDSEFGRLQKMGIPVNSIIIRKDAFYIGVKNGHIIIVGSDGRGTAYAILELSRKAGVSPWIWWGDVKPQRKTRLTIDDNYHTTQSPSVEYRGIFINDEDWSSRVWDKRTEHHTIGPKYYSRLFRLMLRLKANTLWPAMHPGTEAFFAVKGNKEVADSFDIYLGSSHCEPMLRNNVGEWKRTYGDFNYVTNKKQVQNYWTERLEETQNMQAIYTLGMRGIHDGSMEGVKTMQEKFHWLQRVINDQRKLLHKYLKKDPKLIPQIFVPYKEVLDIYNMGLKVPDDVTLMWCDDNYGYLTRLSDKNEQRRSGGAGVYYHLSYWGRPHDYLWLTTTQPGLVYNELRTAYDHNARKIWIINVHDPKVAAYDLNLAMDMAWNINSVHEYNLQQHLGNWLAEQFGPSVGQQLLPVMTEFYHLTGIRKPEFMGWNQVELDKNKYERGLSPVQNTDFNESEFGNEVERYLSAYQRIRNQVDYIEQKVPSSLKDAYFAAIRYPVTVAYDMARKQLEAQESRSISRPGLFNKDDDAKTAAANSMKAYQEILDYTSYYNNQMSGGKWKGIMDAAPRNLPVFQKPSLPGEMTKAQIEEYANDDYEASPLNSQLDNTTVGNACDYQYATAGIRKIQMLGHSMNAVALPKGGKLTYSFFAKESGDAVLRIAVIPTQANDKGDIRFAVSIDGGMPQEFSIKEKNRSEQWKLNVLRGQAIKNMNVNLSEGRHKLEIQALDDHIIVDQWMLDFQPDRQFYVFPIKPSL